VISDNIGPSEDEGDISNKKLADRLYRRQVREHMSLKAKFVKSLAPKPEGDVSTALSPSLITKYQHVSTVSEREWRKLVGMYNTIMEFDPL
jgi:hypothetical protein